MLPLGRRVQDKLEALIDKHMSSLGKNSFEYMYLLSANYRQVLQNSHYHLYHQRSYGLKAAV
jgi:hypothetical protein